MSKQYEKTKWVNEQTPLNAVNLNKIEQGISDAIETSNSNETKLDTLDSTVKDLQIDFVTKTQELEELVDSNETDIEEKISEINTQIENIKIVLTSDDINFDTLQELVSALKNNVSNIGLIFTHLSNKADKKDLFDKDYNSLKNKPTIPSKVSELTNDKGFVTTDDFPTDITETAQKISALEELVNTNENDIEGKVSNIQSQIENIKNVLTSNDVDYDTLQELVNALKNNVSDIGSIFTELAKKADKTSIPTKVSQLTNDSGYLTSHQSLANYYNKGEIDTKETNINNKIDTKANTSDVPTKVSQLQNDEGYLKEHQSLEDYYTKTQSDNLFQPKGDYALKNTIPVVYSWAQSSTKPSYTASEVGLGNVDNTSDLSKPISYATQTALDLKEDKANLKALAYKSSLTKADVGLSNVNNVAITQEQIDQIAVNRTTANDALDIAKGRVKAIVLDGENQIEFKLKNASKDAYNIGDNIFIKNLDSPDYWISGKLETNEGPYGYYEISKLEAQLFNAYNYYDTEEIDYKLKSITNILDAKAYSDNVYTKTEVDNKIPKSLSQLNNDAGYLKSVPDYYLTEARASEAGFIKQTYISNVILPLLNDKVNKTEFNEAIGDINSILDTLNGEVI